MHNHLAYNALPLWSEPGTDPRRRLHQQAPGPTQSTYTESITEPAWVYPRQSLSPQALLAYVPAARHGPGRRHPDDPGF